MIIAPSEEKDLISKVMNGEEVGTLFLPKKNIEGNKIDGSPGKTKEKIIVDIGARNALLDTKSPSTGSN